MSKDFISPNRAKLKAVAGRFSYRNDLTNWQINQVL